MRLECFAHSGPTISRENLRRHCLRPTTLCLRRLKAHRIKKSENPQKGPRNFFPSQGRPQKYVVPHFPNTMTVFHALAQPLPQKTNPPNSSPFRQIGKARLARMCCLRDSLRLLGKPDLPHGPYIIRWATTGHSFFPGPIPHIAS